MNAGAFHHMPDIRSMRSDNANGVRFHPSMFLKQPKKSGLVRGTKAA